METIKKFLGGIWGVVIAVFGVLLFFLYRNKDKVAELTTSLKKAATEKDVALIQKDIDVLNRDMAIVHKGNKDLEKLQVDLEAKKSIVKKQQADKSPKEVEDYWSKN